MSRRRQSKRASLASSCSVMGTSVKLSVICRQRWLAARARHAFWEEMHLWDPRATVGVCGHNIPRFVALRTYSFLLFFGKIYARIKKDVSLMLFYGYELWARKHNGMLLT